MKAASLSYMKLLFTVLCVGGFLLVLPSCSHMGTQEDSLAELKALKKFDKQKMLEEEQQQQSKRKRKRRKS